MPSPTINDVHIDSLRSELSVAYWNDRKFFAGDAIAPIVKVDKKSDLYAVWDRADTMRIQFGLVAEGDSSPIIEMNMSTESYRCKAYKGKVFISDEKRANADSELKLDEAHVRLVNEQALLKREKLIADAFWATSKWGTDSTPSTKWSASSSTPIEDLRVGCRKIQSETGFWPTDLILGADVEDTLLDHSDIIDRISGGARPGDPAVVELEQLAAILKLKRVTSAAATYNSASAGATAVMAPLYDTNDALLVYRPDSPEMFTPSAAYTFSWAEFDDVSEGGAAIKSWRDDDPDGEWMRGQLNLDPKITASAAGYFFNEATS
jgi:hypothetical protein